MRIAVLYICTGKYSIFWDTFFTSSEKCFLKDIEKHYFVFTDDPTISESENIHPIYQNPRGFPMDSLMRFEMFLQIEKKLLEFEYLFFFNANIHFVSEVNKEILPGKDNENLVGVLHPGYLHSSPFRMPFERNRRSTAYVQPGLPAYAYYLGGINGGRSGNYIEMIKTCHQNIQTDLKNHIQALYHDESHINRYFSDKKILKLSPSYGYPEGWNLPYLPRIIILNKVKHGGSYFDKLPAQAYARRIQLFLKRLFAGILWLLKI